MLIKAAIDEWNIATDSLINITIDGTFSQKDAFSINDWKETRRRFFKITSKDPGYDELCSDGAYEKFVGIANESRGNVALVTDRIGSEDAFYDTVLHELGHLMGLSHADKGIMMEKESPPIPCIFNEDLLQYCSLNYCGPNAGSTCYLK